MIERIFKMLIIDQIIEGSQILIPDKLIELARGNHIFLKDSTIQRKFDL